MNVRLRMYEYCYSNLGAIYAKGLYVKIILYSSMWLSYYINTSVLWESVYTTRRVKFTGNYIRDSRGVFSVSVGMIISEFRYIKNQPQTIHLNTRLWGINREFVGFIPQSLALRSIAWDWILIYRNWSIDGVFCFVFFFTIVCANSQFFKIITRKLHLNYRTWKLLKKLTTYRRPSNYVDWCARVCVRLFLWSIANLQQKKHDVL